MNRFRNNLLSSELFQLLEGLRDIVQDAQIKIANIEKVLVVCTEDSDTAFTKSVEGEFTAGPDFRSVRNKGVLYSLRPSQASCVQILYEAYLKETPEVSGDYILEKIGYNSKRLSDLFKKHPAWGTLIIPGRTKGTYQLSIS